MVCDAGEKQIQRRMLLKTTIERLEEGCRHEAWTELDKAYGAHDADEGGNGRYRKPLLSEQV